jgi:CheY-like chemotaxis protein
MSDKKQLGTLLVEAGLISPTTLVRALERQKGSGKRLGIVLEEMGVITEGELVDALAKQFGFRTVKGFAGYSFPKEVLDLVHEDMAVCKQVFPLKVQEGTLALAVTDPFDFETFDYLAKKTGKKVMPVLATRQEIMAAVSGHYLRGKEVRSAREKVLVVDDSPAITSLIASTLKKEGYEVVTAVDGMEGFKLAISERPDLVICDSVMPRMDGFALLRALRGHESTAGLQAILLTSKASGEEEQRAFDAGFLDFIPKPVQPIRILSRVKHAFELLKAMKK